MAVAVKHTPGTSTSSPLERPAVLSLLGVVYLLAALAVVFQLVPWLWWQGWQAAGFRTPSFMGGALLICLDIAVLGGLMVVGSRLLGPRPPVGVRSGIFGGLVLLMLTALLTRWASNWAEVWVYQSGLLTPTQGLGVAVAAGLFFLGLAVYLFNRPGMQRFLVRLEQGGWFQATAYKPSQGQRVRRATVLGILLLGGAGIWTLISHGTLRRGSADWAFAIPFTGKVAVEKLGDVKEWLIKKLPAEAKSTVQVRTTGLPLPSERKGEGRRKHDLQPGQVVPADTYKEAVKEVIEIGEVPPAAVKAIEAVSEDPVALGTTVNKQIIDEIQKLLDRKLLPDEPTRNLRDQLAKTDEANPKAMIEAFVTQMENANKKDELEARGVFSLPTAVVLVDRHQLDKINAETDKEKHIKFRVRTDPDFLKDYKEGDIVETSKFEEEVARFRKRFGADFKPPERVEVRPASGPIQYAQLTIVPSVQYTLPLLLIALTLWVAWRVVNMPTFGDFLIATEAEMNKVSWPTQKRLAQDTIVVLVALLLMASYLFIVDQIWRIVLSWEPVGVLVFPKETDDRNTDLERKKW